MTRQSSHTPQRRRGHPGAVSAVLALSVAALALLLQGGRATASTSSTTVDAPNAGSGATVTVSDTKDLVNQSVSVSWTGFTPSSATVLNNGGGYPDEDTKNPVRVYECRGADPASSSDCYGSLGFAGLKDQDGNYTTNPVPGYTYSGQTDSTENSPDGPPNYEDTVTDASGKGQVTIELFTTVEAPTLGCAPSKPCSIVVVPNYGNGTFSSATEQDMDAPWAWADRAVVPLTFASEGQTCSLTQKPLSVEGAPIDARLMASWQIGICHAKSGPADVNYTAISEPQTRSDFSADASDVGLTTLPLTTTPSSKPVYAPFSLSSFVVAFQIDDANGQPVTHLNLDPRLVAKIMTASYYVANDPNISPNASFNLFHDPEFLKLNPDVQWPDGTPGNHPIILADNSDLTYELTRWMNSDKDARAFLNGTADPSGMTVNKAYQGIKLPVSTWPSLDPNQTRTFDPIQGLAATAQQLAIAQFPGGYLDTTASPPETVKYSRQNPGSREVIGIIDASDADEFRMHTAALENPAGKYVLPTNNAVLAAASHMTVAANGVTREVNLANKDAAAYPLTIASSAVVPTKAPKAQRTAVAHLLTYASGAGQTAGSTFGDLPPGYVPLPKSLLALTTTAIHEVTVGAAAATTKPTTTPSPTPSLSSTASPAPAPSTSTGPQTVPAVTIPPATTTTSGSPPLGTSPLVAIPNHLVDAIKSLGSGRTTVVWVLILGGLAFLAGPIVIWGPQSTAVLAAIGPRLRRFRRRPAGE